MTSEQFSINDAAVAIRDAIIANPLGKKFSFDSIAGFHVDRKRLLPVFKELTGKTIKRFQFERSMIVASEMLLSGMTVKEVAIECGYQDYQNNFTRGFKDVFGLGPEEWLRTELKKRKNNVKGQGQKKVHS
ncbi:MAG: AraC family transcriptional regulator [Chitinophagaceae bacterium]